MEDSKENIISALQSPSQSGSNIVVLGTCDSKLQELLLLRQYILDAGATNVSIIDVGRSPVIDPNITVSQEIVANYAVDPSSPRTDLSSLPRGEVIKFMSERATKLLGDIYESAGIHGCISAGGSGGSSLIAPAFREALPIGFPKLLVSTVASGDTGPLVGETDTTMMYSVVDIAGSNSLLKAIFQNAAGAIVGMGHAYQRSSASTHSQPETNQKKRIALTMFGVTTPAVDACRKYLEEEHQCECFVFHATGKGGKAMERLVEVGKIDAVLDITTTEICDHLTGGNMSAGPHRLEAAARAGIPYVISLGATSMVNFGARSSVPQKYSERLLYEHNPIITLMRTNEDECKNIGEYIAEKLRTFSSRQGRVQVVIPAGGVCMISVPGGPFADAAADEALFGALEKGLQDTTIRVIRDDRAINDEGFAIDISKRLMSLME